MSELSGQPEASKDLTLDPQSWSEFRQLAHEMVDDIFGHLESLRSQPVWQEMPEEIEDALAGEPLPMLGQGEASAYRDFMERVLPYPNGNLHPRFYGWVQGNGVPLANMADLLASAMNPHLAGHHQAPVLVEQKVIAWMAELMGFPVGSSGILQSGGTMANVLGLAVARHDRAGFDVRSEGLQENPTPLTVYCSSETHGWIRKGVELLGIGTRFLRNVPVDPDFRMDMAALAEEVERDTEAGLRPICVVGTAGTVNTGAIDDLNAIADFCQENGLWFHVDGAFGALARLSPNLRDRVRGVERADSLAVDLHKWMYLPFEIACLLVRDSAAHEATFAYAPSYLAGLERGVTAGGLPLSDRGIDLTRGFKALKAWMCLKAFGVDKFGALVEQNVRQAKYLAERIEADPNFELLSPVPLNVVCFRYVDPDLSEAESAALNVELLLRIQESGVAMLSSTNIHGKFALRFCNVNHRSRMEDIDLLLAEAVRQAHSLAG